MKGLSLTSSFDIIIDNYFTSFHLLTHLGVNNIWTTGVLNKNGLRKCNIIGRSNFKQKERGHVEQRTSSKKAV